jgi:glucokinase
MGAKELAVGVDLGGTKIAVGVFESGGRLVGELVLEPTLADGPAEGSQEALLSAIDRALATASVDAGELVGIGVGAPGPLDPAAGTLLEVPTLPQLHYFPLRGTLHQRYETRVELNNDANCFALGEAFFGAARGAGIVLGITLGTGCGAGIVVDGKLHEGATCNAGELYRALCGRRTFDEALSGPGLERLYLDHCGEKKSGAEIAELARAGDTDAHAVFDAFADDLARGLGVLSAALDPHIVVLGGSVATAFDCFGESLDKAIGAYLAPSAAEQLKIIASEGGPASATLGAAALVFSQGKEEL